jgi:glycine/D-amino acid oxidase-like deaminating enzyme
MIIENEDDLRAMESFAEQQSKSGLEVSLFDQKATLEREPLLSTKILGSTFSTIEAQVNPYYLNYAFAQLAEKNGATVITHCEVKDICTANSRVRKLSTTKGDCLVDIVVNACGIHAPKIGMMLGVEIPIKPQRGQVIISEEMPALISSIIITANTAAVKYAEYNRGINKTGVGVEQSHNGNLIFGATREYVGFNSSTTLDGLYSISKHIVEIFPSFGELQVIRTFSGLRPTTDDGLPILGPVEGIGGLFIAAGHGGDGVCLSAVTGQIISSLIVNGKSDYDIIPFSLSRFSTSSSHRKC